MSVFDSVLPALARNYHVTRLNLPGYGQSCRAYVAKRSRNTPIMSRRPWIKLILLTRAHVFAHGFGAFVPSAAGTTSRGASHALYDRRARGIFRSTRVRVSHPCRLAADFSGTIGHVRNGTRRRLRKCPSTRVNIRRASAGGAYRQQQRNGKRKSVAENMRLG